MLRREWKELEWLEFELLAEVPRLKHAIFLRHGGHSQGSYNGLNISFDVGDVPSHVEANISLVKQATGIPTIVWATQCHGNAVLPVKKTSFAPTASCDGLHTDLPNVGLMIKHADCQAALIYDPIHHAVANVHAGWRGSVQNIYSEAIQAMRRAYGSHPSDLLVGISPSLGPESAQFIHYERELPQEFHSFQVKPYYFDFWAISRSQLESCGVLSHHIEIAHIDTYANPSDYFSFRRDKSTGRHGTIVSLLDL